MFFTRKNVTIGIAGNYSSDFLKKLKSDMGTLSKKSPAVPKPARLPCLQV
jgi:zinc protease